jgi:hypothetical protein
MERTTTFEGWTIQAWPTIIAKQRLSRSGVIVRRGDEHFVFHELGNFVYRDQAYERGIEWAKQWIINNYGYSRISHG